MMFQWFRGKLVHLKLQDVIKLIGFSIYFLEQFGQKKREELNTARMLYNLAIIHSSAIVYVLIRCCSF